MKANFLSSILLNFILAHKINRDSIIISIGGGVTGDLVGFASSIVLRGVKCIHIPTTLLSQVDSSVGGKTGINTKHGKNLVGTFYQPEGVLIDINFLKTLPQRELLAGFAEVIKYSFIYDKKFFSYLEKNIESIKKLKSPYIENIIFKSCQIKAKIVSIDEKEQGKEYVIEFMSLIEKCLRLEGYISIYTETSPAVLKFYQPINYIEMSLDDPDGYESDSRHTSMRKLL